jgi:hypothetical protein
MFLTQTQPYISFVINMFSMFSHKPQTPHLDATKHLFCYIKGIIDLGICYWRKEANILIGFSNADWVGDLQDRKSTTRYVFRLGSSPITWGSRKQPCIALSSTEVEYLAFTSGAKEAIWLRRLLAEI